jgi:hypothetical protein
LWIGRLSGADKKGPEGKWLLASITVSFYHRNLNGSLSIQHVPLYEMVRHKRSCFDEKIIRWCNSIGQIVESHYFTINGSRNFLLLFSYWNLPYDIDKIKNAHEKRPDGQVQVDSLWQRLHPYFFYNHKKRE